MRYRIRVTRAQVAERAVSAVDEQEAVGKIQAELEKPYSFLGHWTTSAVDIEVIGAEVTQLTSPSLGTEGPLLLSVKDAATQLGISHGSIYELMNRGELEYVRVGRRRLVSRDALRKFIETNTRTG
jgi:excisionase family DNA binding protein